jgi:hypothetical protein
MSKAAGYEIKFVRPDKRMSRIIVGEPNERKAKLSLQAKYGDIKITSCRPLDAKALREFNVERNSSRESISRNEVSDDSE